MFLTKRYVIYSLHHFIRISWLIFLGVLLTSYQGLIYRHLTTSVPQSIHVLEVDPFLFSIKPAHAYEGVLGRETVKTIAHRYGALAAINGGFFEENGLPAGILKINHQWFGLPKKPRGVIGWTENADHVLIDQLLCKSLVIVQGSSLSIQGLNRARKAGEIIVFTPQFGPATLPAKDGLEVIIRNNKIISITKGGSHFIPSDGWVLSISPQQNLDFWENLPKDCSIQMKISPISQSAYTASTDWINIPHIVGGTPILIRHHHIISDFSLEKTKQTFLTQRHARSAIGILPNGHWLFIVVDGNQPTISKGMTMKELAFLMQDLGCVEALNLDGGGSSTLVIEDKIVNDPVGDQDEDQGQKKVRRVSDAILIIQKEKKS